MPRMLLFLVATLLDCALSVAPATAAAPSKLPSSSSISFGDQAPVPIGYYDLCIKQPSVCRPRSGRLARTPAGAIHATPELLDRLQNVSMRVNRAIRPIADASTPGLREWRVSTSAGNCKDYALSKRQQLLAEGFPSSATLIAIRSSPRRRTARHFGRTHRSR